MANLLGEPFPDYVNSQINARQLIYGKDQRTSEEISYLNSSNGWVKLASGVEVDESRLQLLRKNRNLMAISAKPGKDLALNNVLFNGLSSYTEYMDEKAMDEIISRYGTYKGKPKYTRQDFNKGGALQIYRGNVQRYDQSQRSGIEGSNAAYGIDGVDFGYSPMPGIIDLSVKDLNRGSIKKATLNIKANNRNQLEIIDCLYMRLGYTVLLEWGHSKYWDDTQNKLVNQPPSLIDTEFFKDSFIKSDYTKFLPLIKKHKEKTRGNYDAMFGTVSNFSWTFENDGSYNCKIEIISLGDIIESLNINVNTGQSAAEAKAQSQKLTLQAFKDKPVDNIDRFYSDLYPTLEQDLQNFYNKNVAALKSGDDNYYILNADTGIRNRSIYGNTVESDRFSVGGFLNLMNRDSGAGSRKEWTDNFKFVNTLGVAQRQGNFVVAQIPNTSAIPQSEIPTDEQLANDVGLQQLNINNVFYNVEHSDQENLAGKGIFQFYLAEVLTTTFQNGSQVLLNLSDINSPTQTLNSINTPGPFHPKSNLNTLNNPNYITQYSGSLPNPNKDNQYTGYNPENLRGNVVLSTATAVNNPGSKINSNEPIGFLQLARITYNGALVPIMNGKNRGGGTQRYTWFAFSSLQKQVLGELCDFESFKQFVFETFKNRGLAGGKADPRFKEQNPEVTEENENEGEVQIAKFLKLANEKSVRGNFFKFFYNIRTFYEPEAVASDKSKEASIDAGWFWFDTTPLNDIVEFKNLKKNPKIKAFGKTVGYILNPLLKSDKEIANNWNETIKFPLYKLSKIYNIDRYASIDKKNKLIDRNSLCDFFKLNITNIDKSFYIRLGTLLAYIKNISIPGIDSGENPPMINMDITTGDNVCYVIDNVISTNPKKLIIRNHQFYDGTTEKQDIFSGLSKFIGGDSEKGYYGNLMNVYFNFSRIEEIISNNNKDGNLPLFDFIATLCQDINESLGHINNLEPTIDKETNTITIIDQTVIPNKEELFPENYKGPNPAVLEVFGYNNQQSNFVHNIGITTQISKEYATMITIGATSKGAIPGAEATAFSKWNIGITDRFKNNLTSAESATSNSSNALDQLNEDNKLVIENYNSNIKRTFNMLGFSENELNEEIFLTFNDEFIKNTAKVCKDFYIYEQARSTLNDQNDIIESSIGFIPFNLKVDMDGLSGMKIYNRLNVNTEFLPSNYEKTLDFIITGVNHQVSNNKWTTSLETLATSKSVLGGK